MTSVMLGSDYIIQTAYVRGPIKSNPGFNSWASSVVANAYEKKNFSMDSVGYYLSAEMVSQPETRDNNTLWLATRVVCKNGAKISLRRLEFYQHSNDGIDSLASTYKPGQINTVYGPATMGVNWNGPTMRVNDTIVPDDTTGLSEVDEIIFIGLQSPFYTYSSFDANGVAGIQRYISSFSDFRIQGMVKVVEDGQVLATSGRALYANKRQPTSPVLSISKMANNKVSVLVDIGPDDQTVILQSSSNPIGPWEMEENADVGIAQIFPVALGTQKFFRAMLE